MKKVTLLGDSIRQIGYGPIVPALLGDEFQVWQPAENCRFAQYTLRGMWDWAHDMEGSEIVHWNNGLWDISTRLFDDGIAFTSEEEYLSNMLRIATQLKKLGKRIIFATTTPCHPLNEYNDNKVIVRYNEILVPKLQEMGIEINDLYSLVNQDILKYIREDDKIHLTDEEIAMCAAHVVKVIKGE